MLLLLAFEAEEVDEEALVVDVVEGVVETELVPAAPPMRVSSYLEEMGMRSMGAGDGETHVYIA